MKPIRYLLSLLLFVFVAAPLTLVLLLMFGTSLASLGLYEKLDHLLKLIAGFGIRLEGNKP